MIRYEEIELTNMCMVCNAEGLYLVEDRLDPYWSGLVFPGGHVEKGESAADSVIREVREETGIIIDHPKLCGLKQFYTREGRRYLVLLYQAEAAGGELRASGEGNVMWLTLDEIRSRKMVPGFPDMLKVFLDDSVSELIYRTVNGQETAEFR